ncbi:MAG: hypothetical protein IT355_17125 [Gemmatimonadaceae bacterium]|nr:hypothetical protein [Gemmatimonadaceae bacterium]
MRVDPALLESMQRWANADLRSLNGQIEFVLRRALQRDGRLPAAPGDAPAAGDAGPSGTPPAG